MVNFLLLFPYQGCTTN